MDAVTRDVLSRLDRELDERSPTASSTEKLGGVMKTGAELENLLERLVLAVAAVQGEARPLVEGKQVSRATAAELLRELRRRWSRGLAAPPSVCEFVGSVVAWDGWFYSFMTYARNPAAHTGTVNEEDSRRFMTEMRDVVFAFRHRMGWRA